MPCGVHTIPYGSKYIEISERIKRCMFCRM